MGSLFAKQQKVDNATMTVNQVETGTQSSAFNPDEFSQLCEHPELQYYNKEIIRSIYLQIHKQPSDGVTWDSIGGLKNVKKTLERIIILPMNRHRRNPNTKLFIGLREPPNAILLFGPPGNGKTMIGRCIASQCDAKFFNISTSGLLSKWLGDSEQLVSALFNVAQVLAPSIIFFDEIDSLLSARKQEEEQHMRSIKNEFLAKLDGIKKLKGVLVIGATNKPKEIDEAARRRFTHRIYVPLPSDVARKNILFSYINQHPNVLSDDDWNEIVKLTEGFSGADLKNACREAANVPMYEINDKTNGVFDTDEVAPIKLEDCKKVLKKVKRTVRNKDLEEYEKWNQEFGMGEE